MQSTYWKSGLKIAHSLPRCGAKSKTNNGLPCKAVAMANGRCRMHGGVNPGAPEGTKHGRYRHGGYTREIQQIRKFLKVHTKLNQSIFI